MAGNKHETHGEQEPRPLDVEAKHEVSDINAWAVGKFAIALVIVCIASIVLLLGVFRYFLTTDTNKPESAGIGVDAGKLPPQPRLEETPVLDLQRMREAEDRLLNGYGWVDKQNGVAHIPISLAIDLLAQKGLPARSQADVQTASDASVPTESSLGLKAQQEGGPLGVKK